MSDLIEIGALWKGKGKALATGRMGKGRLVVLENDKKGNDKAPDWRLFIAPDNREREEKQDSGGWGSAPARSGGTADLEDDIPW